MEDIIRNNIYFDNVQNNYIEEFKDNLETLKTVDYELIQNQNMSNSEVIDLYKDVFTYLFFATYDKYINMLKQTNQYISSSFVSRYFKFVDNKLYYQFKRNLYIIIDSGYEILLDNNYDIELKINKENDYLWYLKPIIRNNHLYYYIKYNGYPSFDNSNLLSIKDIENIQINIFSKNYINTQNILFRNNEES